MNKKLLAECIFVTSVIAIGIGLTALQQIDISKPEEQIANTLEIREDFKPVNTSRADYEETLKKEHEIINKDEVVVEQQTEVKEPAKSYTDEDLYVLSHVIMGEASGQSWEHKEGVGSVVLNRVKDSRFPNTIKGVVFQKGQYACTWDGNYNKTPDEETVAVAKFLLENGSQLPESVIWQANFKQGKGVYKQLGNTYFCY